MVEVRCLNWDSWNVAHIARHGVTPDEVTEVCHSSPLVQQTYRGRLLLIGLTRSGRMLAVVLAPEEVEGTYYPVTARSADRKERRTYREQMGVTDQ